MAKVHAPLVKRSVRNCAEIIFLALALATTAAATTYPFNQFTPSTISGMSYFNNVSTPQNFGYRFTANSAINVTQLGMAVRSANNGLVYNLKLWTFSSQQTIASATLTADGTGAWQWATLGSPVSLTQGQDYVVTVSAPLNSQVFVDQLGSLTTPTGAVLYKEARNSGGGDVFPTQTYNVPFGFADIGYTAAPAPTPISNTGLLTLAGMLALAGWWALERQRQRV